MPYINQNDLKNVFEYLPETGEFLRLITKSSTAVKGMITKGSKDQYGRYVLTINYKNGMPGFLQSESNFNYLELAFSQSFNVKKFWRIDINLTSGKFMQQEFLHFNDFYHFPTGRTLKTSHPVISTFRILPYYEFSTNNYFHRIHIQTQTANFLLSKWSFIKKSRVLENIFINLAITDKLQPFLEMGYALDNILKN